MESKTSHTSEFRFKCIKCGNCCTDQKTIVNLTYPDILRIKEGLNLSLKEVIEIIGFYIYDKELSEEERKKMVITPMMTEKGLAFAGLRKDDSGVCYFYDKTNERCKMYDLRPNFCRTFPFYFKIFVDKRDKTRAKIKMDYTEKGKQYCPGIGVEMPFINEDDWIKVGVKAIEDLNDNHIVIQRWNDAIKSGQITLKVENFLLNIFKLQKKN